MYCTWNWTKLFFYLQYIYIYCREEGMGVREEDKDRGGTSEGQRLKTDKVRSAFFNLF